MGLFNDYESSGTGISKSAPKKKGISLFFDIFWRKAWQLAGINLLYFLFFMPLFLVVSVLMYVHNASLIILLSGALIITFLITIGPATAGMVKVLRCYLIEKHTFVIRDFFRGFRANFKRAFFVGFVDCLVIASAIASLAVYPALAAQTGSVMLYVPMIITYSFLIVVIMMNYYIYLMMVATTLSFKNLIKNSFALVFIAMKRNIITSLLIFLILLTLLPLLLFAWPMLITLLPLYPAAFIAFVVCFRSYPVIQKYVINPYYESIGQINPELTGFEEEVEDVEKVFEDMGGKERPIEKRKKGKGKHIS